MATELCRSCGSCGFPMKRPDDFAGGDMNAQFCSTCADAKGKLKPFNQAVEANANYFVREQGIDAKAAREMARALLLSMPAWKA
jgi:Putative zinc ribbon domain